MTERHRLAPTLEAELSAEDAAWLRASGWNDAAVAPSPTPTARPATPASRRRSPRR
ncbi:MAG: hypothetical protein HZY79_08810 [Rhodoblastus sp.]|nr:MAG: hypothetical protein HZY79_08810 [Rhodoblastus sp.]